MEQQQLKNSRDRKKTEEYRKKTEEDREKTEEDKMLESLLLVMRDISSTAEALQESVEEIILKIEKKKRNENAER